MTDVKFPVSINPVRLACPTVHPGGRKPGGHQSDNMPEYSLGDAMKDFLNKSRLKNGITALQIEKVWEDIMGKTIAKYTDKIEIVKQTVFIQISVAPLKQELLYQKDKIIERINEAMGEQVINAVVIK